MNFETPEFYEKHRFSKTMMLRMTEDQYEFLQNQAKQHGLKTSAFCRQIFHEWEANKEMVE